jgi:hypothetical protein
MTPEDEEFQRISREIKRRLEEDDDIQEYKKPWVSLTDEEMLDAIYIDETPMERGRRIERILKEKNF